MYLTEEFYLLAQVGVIAVFGEYIWWFSHTWE